MAAVRKFSPCLRIFSRAFSHFECKVVLPRACANMCVSRHVQAIPKHNFAIAATAKNSQLESLLQNGTMKEIKESVNEETDVYMFGMPFRTTKEQIKTFFKGIDIEEICYVDVSRARRKEFYYVRFKDAESKQKGLEKHKDVIGHRYVEVFGVESYDLLAFVMAIDRSLVVKLRNLPFNSEKEDIIQFLKPANVTEDDISFLKEGVCSVHLHNEGNRSIVLLKSQSTSGLGGRRIRVEPHLTEAHLEELKNM